MGIRINSRLSTFIYVGWKDIKRFYYCGIFYFFINQFFLTFSLYFYFYICFLSFLFLHYFLTCFLQCFSFTFFLSLYVVFFLYYIFFTFFYSFYIFFSFYVSCVLSFYVVFFLCIYTYMDIICTIIIIWYINKNFVKFILHTTCIINKIQFSLNKVESSFDKKKIPKTQEYLKSYKFLYVQSV